MRKDINDLIQHWASHDIVLTSQAQCAHRDNSGETVYGGNQLLFCLDLRLTQQGGTYARYYNVVRAREVTGPMILLFF